MHPARNKRMGLANHHVSRLKDSTMKKAATRPKAFLLTKSKHQTLASDLPHSVSLISAIPTQGSCSGYPEVVCELGQLSPGDSAEVSINVSIAMSTRGQLVNTVVASSTAPDNILANNAATAVTHIPSIGAWSMAALAALLSALTLWKITTRRGAPS